MKFITFQAHGVIYPGVLEGCKAIALQELGYSFQTLEQCIAQADTAWLSKLPALLAQAHGFPLSEVRLLPPIPSPAQEIIVMQNNYCKTPAEAARFREAAQAGTYFPTFYYKKAAKAITSGDVIHRYEGFLTELDVQAELCVVVGRPITSSSCNPSDHIFGYTLLNNVIAHDITAKHRRPYISTSLDTFLVMAPWIVTADEFQPSRSRQIRSYVNGKLCQDCSTSCQILPPEFALRELAKAGILAGATLLSTGTPFGTLRDLERPFLSVGDQVRCEIDGLGSVCCTVG